MQTAHRKAFMGMAALLVLSAATWAGPTVVPLNEAAIEAIFSQAGFGDNAIDIRFTPPLSLDDTRLRKLAVNTNGTPDEFDDLVALSRTAPDSLFMFFVDDLRVDGVAIDGLAGRNTLAVRLVPAAEDDRTGAAGQNGAALQAHEIGHSLGLSHCGLETTAYRTCKPDSGSLMDTKITPATPRGTRLSPAEIDYLLSSPMLKRDDNGVYLTMTPVVFKSSARPPTQVTQNVPAIRPGSSSGPE